jgi:excinuclease ABC subunit A
MDEPSIGLHQRDNQRLIQSLKQLVAVGNTVLVVEHDKDIMLSSDYLIDLGPRCREKMAAKSWHPVIRTALKKPAASRQNTWPTSAI